MIQQIIDSNTGKLRLTNGFVVSRRTKHEQIISHFVNEDLKIRDLHNGWKHYSILNIKVNDTYLSITYYFNNDILKSLQFIVNDKVIVMRSWDDWSEKEELKNRDYYHEWLTDQIGKGRQFAWGEVAAFCDKKGASSCIYLKYK